MNKQRSRAYPGVSLGVAHGLLHKLRSMGPDWVDRTALATRLGYQNGEGGIAARKIAALVHFGFLERTGNGYCLSDSGRELQQIHEESPAFFKALRTALQQPALFKGIITRFEADRCIPRLALKHVLTEKFGITEQAREEAAEIFFESARFARFLRSDGTFVDPAVIENETETRVARKMFEESEKLVVLLPGLKRAYLELPPNFEAKDLQWLEDGLEFHLRQLKGHLQPDDEHGAPPEVVPKRGHRVRHSSENVTPFPRKKGEE